MAFSVHVLDEQGHELATLWAAHAVYLLPDGSTHLIDSRVVWCTRCHMFRLGEHLRSAEEFEMYLKGLRQMPPAWQDDPMLGEISRRAHENMTRDAIKLQEYLRLRRSPARCLECGSTEIQELDERGGVVPHPAGTGCVRVEDTGLHASLIESPPQYDLEGYRVPT